jgi:CRP/FNR family transcriptional regulator, cyclic AMP receptor protein
MAANYLDERTYGIGDIVFSEGEQGAEMFIVQEGRVVITKQVAGRDVFLAAAGRGDFFGEEALFDSQTRRATCYAMVPSRLLALRSGELLIKLRRDPTFAFEMLQQMSRRISGLESNIATMMEEELASRRESAGPGSKTGPRTDGDPA